MRFLDEYKRKRNKIYVKNKIIENMNVDMFLVQEENGEVQNNPYTDYLQKTIFQMKMFINPRRRKTNQKD